MEIFVRGKVQVGKFNIHSQQTNIIAESNSTILWNVQHKLSKVSLLYVIGTLNRKSLIDSLSEKFQRYVTLYAHVVQYELIIICIIL